MFKNAQSQDFAWSSIRGDGEIIKICKNKNKPVLVQFVDEAVWYHVDGKRHTKDKYPELYHHSFAPPGRAFTPPTRPKYQWLYKDPTGVFCLTRVSHATSVEVEDDFKQHGCTIIEPILRTKTEDDTCT